MGDREVDRLWSLDLQRGIELAAAERADQGVVDLGVALELVVDHRMVGQADAGAVGGLHQDTDVVADSGIVTFDLHFAVIEAGRARVEGVGTQFTLDAVDGRTEANRNLVVEGIADSRLERDDLDVALFAPVACGVTAAVVGYQAERHVNAEADAPVIVDRFDVVTHWYANHRHHVTIGFPWQWAAARTRNVRFGDDGCAAHGDLLALQARHTGRVAIHRAGIIGSGRTTRETCPHAADALFVEGKAGSEQLTGSESNGYAEGGFEHCFFHY